jgi:hypothetical protein
MPPPLTLTPTRTPTSTPDNQVDEPATTKLRKLVRHLVSDGLTTDALSEFAEGA